VNGVHDMGGMHGFGKVQPDTDEEPFHADWEARVLAMQRAIRATRAWNIDMSRDALEHIPPQRYLASSYYERWLLGRAARSAARRRGRRASSRATACA